MSSTPAWNGVIRKRGLQEILRQTVSFHLAFAAFLAISFRFFADMPAARAFPPIRPSATAAAFLPSSVVTSSISPVAILAIMTARAFTSAGRRSPFGPFAIMVG